MATVPGSVLDGVNIGYGTFVGTFSQSGNFIVENFNVTRPVQTARDRKTDGEPNRSRYTQDFCAATATLQAPSGTTGWPVFGETMTVTVDSNYGSETWIVMPIPYTATNEATALRKINVTLEKQNTTTLTTVAAIGAQP